MSSVRAIRKRAQRLMRGHVLRNKFGRALDAIALQYTGEFLAGMERMKAAWKQVADGIREAVLREVLRPVVADYLKNETDMLELPPPMALAPKTGQSRGEFLTSGQP